METSESSCAVAMNFLHSSDVVYYVKLANDSINLTPDSARKFNLDIKSRNGRQCSHVSVAKADPVEKNQIAIFQMQPGKSIFVLMRHY